MTFIFHSDAEFDELMAQLQAAERKKKRYTKEVACCPDMILSDRERRARFFDNRNGFIEDPKEAERLRKLVNPWTDKEKAIFAKKYVRMPKNFRKIASYLPNKSVNECVAFFYSSKMTVNYKQLAKQSARGGSKRKSGASQSSGKAGTGRNSGGALSSGASSSKTSSGGAGPSITAPRKPRYAGIPRELIGLAMDVSAYDQAPRAGIQPLCTSPLLRQLTNCPCTEFRSTPDRRSRRDAGAEGNQ